MKMLLIVLIVLLESIGIELSFIDEASFFDLVPGQKQETELKKLDLFKIASYPEKIKKSEEIEIEGDAYLAFDLASQCYLVQKNLNKKRPIASLTKIMTAVIVLEEMDLNSIVTVSKNVNQTTGSKLWIAPGNKFRAEELLKGMLIRSANDCAATLQYSYDQENGKDEFVKKMNRKARLLGMKKTKFVESTGLSENNRSTVKDLSLLTKYALKKETFRQMIKTYQSVVRTTSGYGFSVINTNRLLRTDKDIFGIKTGYLEEAGQCFIAGAEQNDHEIVTILLGATNNNARFWETRELINGAFSIYRW